MTVRDLGAGFDSYREWATDPRPRVGLGLPFFDNRTNGGLAQDEIAMVQAFSSVGKTAVALNIVLANPTIPVLMFSMEMNWRMVAARVAAMDLRTSTAELEARMKAGDESANQVAGQLDGVYSKFRMFMCDDTPGISLRDATTAFEQATDALGTKPRLVIWDYMELIAGGGLSSKSEQVDKVATKLREWNRTNETRSVVLHQLSQGTGGFKAMSLSSGRYGGYQPMDYVVGAYAPRLDPDLSEDQYLAVKDEIWFQLLKNRAGPAHPVGVRYRLDALTQRITPWDSFMHFQASEPAVQQQVFVPPPFEPELEPF